jgi:hypothetical protein
MFVERVSKGHVQVEDGVYDEAFVVVLNMTEAEVQQLLSEYVPETATTPGVTTCRPLVRSICAKLKAQDN